MVKKQSTLQFSIKNTGGTLIDNMLKITKKLPRELKINEVLNEMKNNRGM